jgi:hypothetical protein
MAKMYTDAMNRVVKETSRRTIDRIDCALTKGDLKKARALHEQNVKGKKGFHDFAVRWVNQTLKHLHKAGGDEAVYECMKDYARTFYPPCVKQWIADFEKGKAGPEDFPMEDFLTNRATLWQMSHDNEQIWHEDEEKIVFTLDPCNSGGYLVREQPDPVVTTDCAHTWCYNKKGFQCYCLNCTTMWEFGWYEWFGWPLFIMEVPQVGSSGRCVMTMYKDPKDIPDSYYKERGLVRRI